MVLEVSVCVKADIYVLGLVEMDGVGLGWNGMRDVVWVDLALFNVVWCGLIWFGLVWCGLIWVDVIWFA